MLTHFRKQKKILGIFLWLVIGAFIGTIFLVWGVGGKNSDGLSYALSVNSHKISYGEYKKMYDEISEMYKQFLGGNVDPKIISKQVQEEIIAKYLIIDEAKRLNIPVSDKEVLTEVTKVPAFMNGTTFDKKRYYDVLQANRISPEDFEQDIKISLLVGKFKNMVINSVKVTDAEVQKEYNYRNTSANVSYVVIDPASLENEVKMDNKELEKYYNATKEQYKEPEKIKLKYIVFEPSLLQTNDNISKADIESYYLSHKNEFSQEEQVRARHILVRVANWDNASFVENAKSKISDVLKKAKGGEAFDALAKKYSDDPSAKNGGDLGFFSKGLMVKEFDEVAFSMKEGQMSNIVKTPFGFHIIKVEGKLEKKEFSLDESKDKIVNILKNKSKEDGLKNLAMKKYKEIITSGNITGYTAKHPNEFKVLETPYFKASEEIEPIGKNPQVKNMLFALDNTEITNVMDVNGKKYIFELADKKEAFIPPFKDVLEQVKMSYIKTQSNKLALEKGKSLIKSNKELATVSEALKTKINTLQPFKRLEPIPQIGTNSVISEKIYKTKPGSILDEPFDINGKIYILKVDAITKPDNNKLSEQQQSIATSIKGTKEQEALKSYVLNLKKKAKIEISKSLSEI